MAGLGREQMADDHLISFEAALELLTLHLQSQMFAPQRPASQVQVLGLLETTGFDYSHLWVCGMDANSFPQTASLNPFIPTEIARNMHCRGSLLIKNWHLHNARLTNGSAVMLN